MKRMLLFLTFISFHSIANFSGHWVNESDSQSLTLDLVEDGAYLVGKYCFITNDGNRIDCSEDNDKNINGIIKDNVGVVDFESTFGGIGQATISIEKNVLKYTITNPAPFVNANMSVPNVIYFKKIAQASGKESTKIITCSLPGGGGKEASFFIDNITKEINYSFEKNGKTELKVVFNEGNKLRRTKDSKMRITYYGFKHGKYSYVINVVEGSEENEYTMSFDIKKNGRIIQSSDCLPGSFRSDRIINKNILDIPYVNEERFGFP
ncbi:TPA: hypothetical protein OFX50_000758 [Escherichia coli]|nr:hypothetical protein [Escherichia coli]HCP7952228.1 hypothetical protein [Escherichia coli]HCP9324040.1 hypothetical protein [Escherichia coli]